MGASEIIAELSRLRVPVFVVHDRLRVPTGALLQELRAQVVVHRDEILAFLTRPSFSCTGCGRFAFALPTTCNWCRPAAVENMNPELK